MEDLTPLQRAYAKITNANGDVSKLVRYTERDGRIVWLEEGYLKGEVRPDGSIVTRPSGWRHINQEIKPSGMTRAEELVNAGVISDVNETQNLIFEIIQNGVSRSAVPSGKIYSNNYNGRMIDAIVGNNGYIVTISFGN